jgi:hypothetical protein
MRYLYQIILMSFLQNAACKAIIPEIDRLANRIIVSTSIQDVIDPTKATGNLITLPNLKEYRNLLEQNLEKLASRSGIDYVEQDALQEARSRLENEIGLINEKIDQYSVPLDQAFYETQKNIFLSLVSQFSKSQSNSNTATEFYDLFKRLYDHVGGIQILYDESKILDNKLVNLIIATYRVLNLQKALLPEDERQLGVTLSRRSNEQEDAINSKLKNLRSQLAKKKTSLRSIEKAVRNTLADNPIIFFTSGRIRSEYVLAMIKVIEAYREQKDDQEAKALTSLLQTIVNDRWGGESKFGIKKDAYQEFISLPKI